MDTPDKNRISAVSLCNFEDSPVFKYINDLSPIEPVKSAPANNVLNAFSFASPSALFTSPQFNSNRESRFSVKRHQSPLDLPNPTFLLDVTVNNSRDSLQAVKTSELCAEQLKCGSTTQLDESSETKPIEEQFSMALRSGSDGCDIQMVSCDEISAGSDNGKRSCGSLMKPDEDMLTQSNDPIELGADLQTLFETEKMKIDNESSVVTSISGVAGVLDSEQQIQKIDPGRDSFTCAPQQFPPIKNVDAVGFFGVQGNNGAPDITLSSSSLTTAKDSNATTEDKEEKGLLPSRKQRSVRRRCLTFDVGGIYKKKPLRDSTNDSPLESTSIEKVASPEKQSVPSKKNTDDILPIPTIGLHLNGLVNTLTDGNKLICKVGRVLTLGPATSNHSLDNQISTPDSTERVVVSSDNGIIDEVSEKVPDAECLDNSLPTGERQQIEGLDESVSCKRCKCRRSKCLKLYCDCFAAGLYCIEPCSCQDCFNKPIHEDIVLSTRRQIEARNPLAFAPKVVASIDSASDLGDENNKTPASARHKRGCNCKKSSCLKKYCECFLMGVGCSPCCRCISCKNSFGQKDEQFRIPCALESDAVTIGEEDINEDVKDLNSHHHHHHHGDHDDIDAPRKIQACQNLEREGYLRTIPDEETSL